MTHTYRIQTLDQAETTVQLQRYLDDAATQGEELVAVSPKFFVFRQEAEAIPIDEAIDRAWIKIDNRITDENDE